MVLRLVYVLFISSVVIASENSCDNVKLGIARNANYVKFNGGFFFIHSLTNGESVVMYQMPNEKKINVQYTFINDDCLYETQSYVIMENGVFVDHVKVLNQGEFLIRKTLTFDVDGKPVEITFKINTTGHAQDISIQVEKFVSIKSNEDIDFCSTGEQINDISNIEFSNKNSLELKYLKNGRFFYQEHKVSIEGKYAFKTTRGHYHTFDYTIDNPFQNNSKITEKSFSFKDIDKFSENVKIYANYQESIKKLSFCFKSTGVHVIKSDNIVDGLSNGGCPANKAAPLPKGC